MSFGDLGPHFSAREFRCKDGSEHPIDPMLIAMLEAVRARFDRPVRILSGYRSPEHNRKVGGAANSLHVQGQAADITIDGVPPKQLYDWADRYFSSGGIGLYRSWVHIDCRRVRARWNKT